MAGRDAGDPYGSEVMSPGERRRRIEERIQHAEERARSAEERFLEALQEAEAAPTEALAERHRSEAEVHRQAMAAQRRAAEIQRDHLRDLDREGELLAEIEDQLAEQERAEPDLQDP